MQLRNADVTGGDVWTTSRREPLFYWRIRRTLIRSGICRTCIFLTRRRSCWCRTISTPTSQPRSTKPSPAPEARRLVERFGWHYTPKHGSWLDMAESELGVLASQCLNRRIADKKILAREVNAWQDHRNEHHAKANWQFKTADARVKLKRLYPQFE